MKRKIIATWFEGEVESRKLRVRDGLIDKKGRTERQKGGEERWKSEKRYHKTNIRTLYL